MIEPQIKVSNMKKHRRTKILLGIVSASLLAAYSLNVAFADVNLGDKLRIWGEKQANEAISSLNVSIQTETEAQKERLREQLQAKLDMQQQQLNQFTEEQANQSIAVIRQHADELIANTTFVSDEERQAVQAQLDQIVASAITQMNNGMPMHIAVPPVTEEAEMNNSNEMTKEAAEESVDETIEESVVESVEEPVDAEPSEDDGITVEEIESAVPGNSASDAVSADAVTSAEEVQPSMEPEESGEEEQESEEDILISGSENEQAEQEAVQPEY